MLEPGLQWAVWCDGTAETGLGHVARCLGFAEILELLGTRPTFLGNFDESAMLMIRDCGFDINSVGPISENASIECLQTFDGVLVDSYEISPEWLEVVQRRNRSVKFAVVDDFAVHANYHCDAIVNFTVAAPSRTYPTLVRDVYLGPTFYPGRNWLRDVREQRSAANRYRSNGLQRILIFASGGVAGNPIAQQLVEAVGRVLPDSSVKVVTGCPTKSLEVALSTIAESSIEELSPNLYEHFVWADACLCGGGLTKYECCYCGIPVAALSQTREQHHDTELLAEFQVVFDLGFFGATSQPDLDANLRHFLLNRNLQASLVEKGKSLFGSGSDFSLEPLFKV